VALCRADGIATTDDRAGTRVLAFKQTSVAANTSVLLAAVNVGATSRLLDTEAVLAGVEQRALGRVLAFGDAGAADTDLIVQTLSGRGAGW
jgi:hypothetical protein